jgi:hypothetical protein
MKIGIITSGNENITLFKFLNKFDHEYFVYYDQINWPYWDKVFEYSKQKVIEWIEFLRLKWIEKIIVWPTYELALLEENKYSDLILPLFSEYLNKYCFQKSLIWKIGLAWDFADIQVWQDLITKLSKEYKLNDNQKNIKKFNFPFLFRAKEVQLWKYYLTTLSYSHFMANKSVKFDLRYFKDCWVDTLIPLNYEYFNYQRVITKYFNFKKQRFHKLETIEKIFNDLELKESWSYFITMFTNWHTEFLTRDKKIIRLLQRWKNIEIKFENI